MTIFINGKEFLDKTIFRVAIDPEFKNVSSVDSYNRREIHLLPVEKLQHGMILITKNYEERIFSIYVEPPETRTQFYFMHIYKTSGLSVNTEIFNCFSGKQVYCNFIGHVDDNQMLSSSLITGHFASYPIDLFAKNNKKLHSFTLIRNPIDRSISHYLYENKMRNPEGIPSIDDFENFIKDNYYIMKDLQSKNITSSMDINTSNIVSNSMLSGKSSIFDTFLSLGNTSRFISKNTYESEWRSHLEKFSLIGTMDNRDIFMKKLISLLNSEGYNGFIEPNIFLNQNVESTKEFKKYIPKSIMNILYDLNKNDMELYDNLISRGL